MKKIKFGVCADLHVDIMHDGEERLKAFLDDCRKEDVDFVIQLGDFCYPDENKKCVTDPDKIPVNLDNALKYDTYVDKDKIISMFKNFEKSSYHVVGNHDCDMCNKKEIFEYYGVDYGPYYSFDMNGFHFVVLDGNNVMIDGEIVDYENGNYFNTVYHTDHPYLSKKQLKWLEKDLAETPYPSVLFSHQRLTGEHGSVLDADALHKIIDNAPNGVLMSMNGHEHIDSAKKINNTWYYNVNSMSNQWLDVKFMCYERYTKEIDEKFPNIKYTVPYKEAVYAIVTMDEDGAFIRGKESEFVGITPDEQRIYEDPYFKKWFIDRNLRMTASVSERYMPFK